MAGSLNIHTQLISCQPITHALLKTTQPHPPIASIRNVNNSAAWLRRPYDTTCFVNRTYRSCDFGRTTKFTTTIRLRYDDVSE